MRPLGQTFSFLGQDISFTSTLFFTQQLIQHFTPEFRTVLIRTLDFVLKVTFIIFFPRMLMVQ